MSERKGLIQFNRRQFMKIGGLASAAAGASGLAVSGYRAGSDPATHTGWVDYMNEELDHKRARFAADGPHYRKVSASRRVDARIEVIFSRFYALISQWKRDEGLSGLDPLLREYYSAHPQDLSLDLELRNQIRPKRMEDRRIYGGAYTLSNAWSRAMGAVSPPPVQYPPEISDFPGGPRTGEPERPLRMKSARKTSRLIKAIAHRLGATVVGIAELNPDWVYQFPMKGRGFSQDKPIEVPAHWTFAIVVGIPMTWDPFLANPNYGTSNDAYSRARIVAFRLASFIRQLGYPARPHTPGTDYDVMVPPVMVDAGIGEQGRHGVIITPGLGANIRPAVVTTNIPMIPDKPIRFGVQSFCRTCTICADSCPSGAISHGGKQVVRGYERYQIDISRCHNFWYSNLGNIGCRICVAVCPYSRRSNWAHKLAFDLTAGDPTRLSHSVLTKLQSILYPGPDPSAYYFPSLGGRNASYRPPPWWLRTEDFIDL